MRSASVSQNPRSPTADLIPTGRPVASAIRSTNSISPSTSENAEWYDGLAQSRPAGTPRMRAISSRHLGRREQAAEAGLGALGELDLDRPHGHVRDPLQQALEREAAGLVAAAEVARPDLVDQLAAVAVRRRESALARVVQAAGQRGAAVERLHRHRRQRAVAHAGDVHERSGPERVRAPVRRPEHLARGEVVVGRGARLALRGRRHGERRVLEDDQAVDLLHLVVRAEAERVDLALRGRVDPPALVAREGPLLVVGGDDVLAQLRADRLQPVAEAPEDREVAADRVLALRQVPRDDARERGPRQTRGADAMTSPERLAHGGGTSQPRAASPMSAAWVRLARSGQAASVHPEHAERGSVAIASRGSPTSCWPGSPTCRRRPGS